MFGIFFRARWMCLEGGLVKSSITTTKLSLLLCIHELKIISNNVSNWYFMTSTPDSPYDRLCHVTRYITSILCAFIIFCGRSCGCWLVLKQKTNNLVVVLLPHFLVFFFFINIARSFFNVVCRRVPEYDALCMLTTQHSILHFTASSLWDDMPQRKKFKFIGFIKTSSPLRGLGWCDDVARSL